MSYEKQNFVTGQVLTAAQLNHIEDGIVAAESAVSAGDNGATFTPAVSSAGVISWTNDKGLENPAPVNIKGPTGATGATGATGPAGADGKDYVLTAADKTEIAEQVENATIVQAPKYVNSVEEMTDTARPYVLASNGHIWANGNVTATSKKEEVCDEGYTYPENSRLGSDGTVQTSGSYAGYTITPFIDLLVYPVPFTLHLEGMAITPTTSDSYTRIMVYDENQTKVSGGNTIVGGIDTVLNVSDSNVTVAADGSTSILFTVPPNGVSAGTPVAAKYVRFSGKITTTPKVYVTYEAEVTGQQWFDTGTTYAPTLTEEEKQLMVEEVAALVDAQLLDIIGDGTVTV